MKKRTWIMELAVILTVAVCIVSIWTYAFALTASAPQHNVNYCGADNKDTMVKFTGTAVSALGNVPADAGVNLDCFFNYGYCIVNRTGTGLINAEIHTGEVLNSGKLFLNGTDSFTINSTNFASTYRQTFADEGGNWFRYSVTYGANATNTIDSINCHFGWK